MRYTIKKFEALTNAELYYILKLRQEIFIIEQACIYPDIDSRDEKAYHLIAFDDGRIVGCLRILDISSTFEESSIGRVVVAENYRRRGIGKKMMLDAVSYIRNELKGKNIKISAQTYVTEFYQDIGFEVVGGEYLEDGIPHVDMVCELQSISEKQEH